MPIVTTEFTVHLGRERLWKILNDPVALGKCVPGCEEVKVLGPADSRWKVKMTIGIVSRKVEAIAKVVERSEPQKLTITIATTDGMLNGSWKLNLAEVTPSETSVTFIADMTAKGSFEWVVNQVIKSQLSKMVDQFAGCISRDTAS